MNLPGEMTVVEIAAPGGPEQLKTALRPIPEPGDNEVLVRVEAAGVNRPDVMQRQGKYPPPPGASDIPGLEIAGEVVALGAKVAGVAIGNEVLVKRCHGRIRSLGLLRLEKLGAGWPNQQH